VKYSNEIDLINAPKVEKASLEEQQKGSVRVVVVRNSVDNKVEKCVMEWFTQ